MPVSVPVPAGEAATAPIALDAQQGAVVAHGAGPLAVLGGPGTGKTTVLEERFIELALSPGCSADRILFLVPNRAHKMALQERLTRRLLFEDGLAAVVEVPVYTWHGFANHLVSRHYDRLGYSEPPVLLTSPEHWGDVRDALANESPDSWSAPYNLLLRNRGFVDEVVDFCIRAEQRLLDPSDLARLVELRPEWADIVRFFEAHRARLRQRSRIDYPTLLADAAELIANNDDLRGLLHRRFTHILVDDAQELARVQQRFLLFLAGSVDDPKASGERSLVVAADPDSAIETFRGAEPDWLDSFDKDFGTHETITLPVSYRSGPEAGRASVTFIGRNGPAVHRSSSFEGSTTLQAHRYGNLAAEMDAVARSLRLAHLQDGTPYDAMAILLTSPRSMLPALERALGALEVPYSISAPDRPLEREAVVRSFIELARFAYTETPDPDVVADLLRSPLAGLTSHQVRELERDAHGAEKALDQLIADLPDTHDAAAAVKHVLELRDLLVRSASEPADRSFWLVWEGSAYYARLRDESRRGLDDPANRELDALVAFSKALGRFVERRRGSGTLLDYLQSMGRADFGSDPWLPPERRSGGVEILSFHAAKGKEWDLVYVCGCVEGSIPKGRRAQGLFDPYFLDGLSAPERVQRNEAEDRRVFYVAATRARQRCVITASPGPSRKGQPSRFIAELTGVMPEIEPDTELPPLTFTEAAARARRLLADPSIDPAGRLAAAQTIARICELDPSCTAALPREWWWRWDWTEGSIPVNAQRRGDDDVPADKLRTSYSRISEYDNCGLKYLLGVVLGLDPSTSHNMFFGTWIHKIFEEVDTGLLTSDAMVFDRYQELFDDKVFPNTAIARQFRHDGEAMLRRYIDQLGPGKALLAESSFRVELDGHVITGRIDRVDKAGKGVMVSDYKTSRYPIWYSDVEKSLQLAIYYLAAQKDPDIAQHGAPVGMRLIYPGHVARGEVSMRVQKPEAAEKILAELPQLMDKVLAEDFRPSPLADCMWCRFKPLCPLWPEGKEVPV
jgi:superfamily I DNA/RNA helicase